MTNQGCTYLSYSVQPLLANQWNSAVAVLIRAYRESLVHAQYISLEPDRRDGHVHLPDAYAPFRRASVLGQVVQPGAQRASIVLTQEVHVPHLESGLLERPGHRRDRQQFPVGKDEGVPEVPPPAGVPARPAPWTA